MKVVDDAYDDHMLAVPLRQDDGPSNSVLRFFEAQQAGSRSGNDCGSIGILGLLFCFSPGPILAPFISGHNMS